MEEQELQGDQEDVDMDIDIDDDLDGFVATEQVDEQTQLLAAGLASRDPDELMRALQEMLKVLASSQGGKVLRQYVLASPRCAELLSAWEAGSGAPTTVPLMLLLCEMLRHPVGKAEVRSGADRKAKAMTVVQARLDKLARAIARAKMKDMYSHLFSTQRSRQKAALKLMSSIVLRGKSIAVEVATNFDFTLEALKKLAQHPYKAPVVKDKSQGLLMYTTRFFFIEFALSFLVVGDPGLLRWILQKRPLYAGVLHGLAKDEESTIIQVLKILQEKVMAPASLVPAGLQSAVFGDVALEQLSRIAGDELFTESADLAHETLMSLCTDPSHGLCPEVSLPWEPINAKSGAHGGNQGRLLRLMLRLRVTEAIRHQELLLAIARARPKLAAAYLDSVPYSLEPRPSSTWFTAMSIIAELIHLSSTPPPFSMMSLRGIPIPDPDGPLVRSHLRHLLPRALTKVALNRGLQHANVLVKHACLRVLLEALLSLELFLDAAFAAADCLSTQSVDGYSHESSMTLVVQEGSSTLDEVLRGEVQSMRLQWLRLVGSIQDTMRLTLPDPNVLLIIHSTLHTGNSDLIGSSDNRKRTLVVEGGRPGKRRKRNEGSANDEVAEVHANDSDITSDSEGGGGDEDTSEAQILSQIWGADAVFSSEGYSQSLLHAKVLEALAAYQRVVPVAFADKGFDPFKLLPSNPMRLSPAQQEAFLSLLLATTGGPQNGSEKSKYACRLADTAGLGLMYKHVKPLLKLMIGSDVENVRDSAHLLASRLMVITGAFDSNPWEATLWLDHLLRLDGKTLDSNPICDEPGNKQSSQNVMGSIGDCVVAFLSEAVGTVGRALYKYLDLLFSLIFAKSLGKDSTEHGDKVSGSVAPEIGPFVVCILEHTLRVLRSDSKSLNLPQRSAISLYVVGALTHLLQIQNDTRPLGSIVTSLLSPEFDAVGEDPGKGLKSHGCEWIPLRILYERAKSFLNYKDITPLKSLMASAKVNDLGQFRDVLTACKEGSEDNIARQKDILVSSLICAPRKEVSKHLILLVEVCADVFEGPIPVLITMCGVHHDLLSDVDFTSKDMKKSKDRATARELVVSEILTRFSRESSNLDLLALPASTTKQASALYHFLRSLPFSVLFPAVMHGTEGKIFTTEVLSAALKSSYLSLHVRDRPPLMQMILSIIRRLAYVSLTSLDKVGHLDICFTYLKKLVVPPEISNIGGEDEDRIEAILMCKLMVEDSLKHPALTEFCLRPTGMEVGSMKCQKSARLLDVYILDYLMSVLESCSSLDLQGKSREVAQLLGSLKETTFSACSSYAQQAMTLFSLKFSGKVLDEDETKFCEDFVLVRSFVTKLAPYVDPNTFLQFLADMVSLEVARTPLGVSSSSVCLEFARIFFVCCPQSIFKSRAQTLRIGSKAESIGTGSQELLVNIFRYIVKEVLKDNTEEGDTCLLSALQTPIITQATSASPISPSSQSLQLICITPLEVMNHCVQHPTTVRCKIARILVQASTLHGDVFGQLLYEGTREGKFELDERPTLQLARWFLQEEEVLQGSLSCNLSDDHLLLLLPAAAMFFDRRALKPATKVMTHVASIYAKLLTKHFKSWDKFVEKVVEVTGMESLFLNLKEKNSMNEFHDSFCGGMLTVLKHCLCISPISSKKCVSLLRKLLPRNGLRLADLQLDSFKDPEDDFCILLYEVYGKAAVAKEILSNLQAGGPEESEESLHSSGGDVATSVSEQQKRKSKVADIIVRFAGNLMSTLSTLFNLTTQMQTKMSTASTLRLVKLLEEYLQIQVIQVVEFLNVSGFEPDVVPLFQNFAKTCLQFKFGNVGVMKVLQALAMHLTLASDEDAVKVRDTAACVLELVLAHSQFVPSLFLCSTISKPLPLNLGHHAGKGTVLSSLPSILSLIGSPTVSLMDLTSRVGSENDVTNTEGSKNPMAGNDLQEESSEVQKLLLVKLVRSLFQLKMHTDGLVVPKEDQRVLEDLLSLLLAVYGATTDKVDLELLALMRELELYGGRGTSGLAGMDFLWGEAALKRRRARAEENSLAVNEDMKGQKSTLEARKQMFKEDLAVDPRRCGLSVLFFPATMQAWTSNLIPSGTEKVGDRFSKGPQGEIYGSEEQRLRLAAYDPSYILPFALHGLAEGCIDAEEFVRLGMLAVTMASLSSSHEAIRKLGYEILAKYLAVLEEGPSFKGQPQIRLLLTYVKNAITEPWQQLPFVLMLFAAESSCILMHAESHHYMTITRYLLRGPGMDLEYVPLFHSMFGSGSPRYRSERSWMLRLLACGLTSSQDARVYRRQFVLEILMSFYSSPLADTFTRRWVLQVLRRAARIRPCAQGLIDRAGFLPWLASAAVDSRGYNISEQDGKEDSDLVTVVLEVIESVMRWKFMEQHGLGEGFEELTIVALLLHHFLTNSASTSRERAIFRRPTIRIMTSVLRLSQRRKKHQTHFSLSLQGVLDAIRWVESEGPDRGFGTETTQETRALALQMILNSSPPASSTHKDKLLLCQIASWAVPASTQVLVAPKHSEGLSGKRMEAVKVSESSPAKLSRWLAASLVLGITSLATNEQRSALADSPGTCWSVLVDDRYTDFHPINESLAIHLLDLQGHIVGEGGATSAVTSLAALWPFSAAFSRTKNNLQGNEPVNVAILLVETLLSNIPAPEEADSSWRWSFNNAWRSKLLVNCTTYKATPNSYLFQTELCYTVLTIFQQLLLGQSPSELARLISQWAEALSGMSLSPPICLEELPERLNCTIEEFRRSSMEVLQ